MGGGICIRVYADVLKADFIAYDRASSIASQNIEASAGTHTHDGRLFVSKVCQLLDSFLKAAHQLFDLRLFSEHGRDHGRIGAHALHQAKTVQNIQGRHVQNRDALGIIGNLKLRLFAVSVQTLNRNRLWNRPLFHCAEPGNLPVHKGTDIIGIKGRVVDFMEHQHHGLSHQPHSFSFIVSLF